jgi:hypothetical protein
MLNRVEVIPGVQLGRASIRARETEQVQGFVRCCPTSSAGKSTRQSKGRKLMQIPNPSNVRPIEQLPKSVTEDVLHIPAQTQLTPEEVAKAVAHHNKHHKDKTQKDAPGAKVGKKTR